MPGPRVEKGAGRLSGLPKSGIVEQYRRQHEGV
jgi:hypothetical protein